MAHAAVVVQGGVFFAAMSKDGCVMLSNLGWIGFAIVMSLLLLIHIYMRWQLRLRRFSAIQIDGMSQALAKATTQSIIKEDDLVGYSSRPTRPSCFRRLCDYFVCYKKGQIPWNHNAEYCPRLLACRLRAASKDPRIDMLGECIPTLASLLMMVGFIIKTIRSLCPLQLLYVGLWLLAIVIFAVVYACFCKST